MCRTCRCSSGFRVEHAGLGHTSISRDVAIGVPIPFVNAALRTVIITNPNTGRTMGGCGPSTVQTAPIQAAAVETLTVKTSAIEALAIQTPAGVLVLGGCHVIFRDIILSIPIVRGAGDASGTRGEWVMNSSLLGQAVRTTVLVIVATHSSYAFGAGGKWIVNSSLLGQVVGVTVLVVMTASTGDAIVYTTTSSLVGQARVMMVVCCGVATALVARAVR